MSRAVDGFRRRLYAGRRPTGVAQVLNRFSAGLHALGVWPGRFVTLQVRGRRTGRLISFPLVMADLTGERYLVSMLGERANWVHNLRAAGGDAVLLHGRREDVHLEEVEEAERPPILRRYLECAPGARAHVPVDRHASLAAFAGIAAQIPVFRLARPPVVAHPVVLAVLRSPIGRLLGGVCELRLVGRASGRDIALPVQCARTGTQLVIYIGAAASGGGATSAVATPSGSGWAGSSARRTAASWTPTTRTARGPSGSTPAAIGRRT